VGSKSSQISATVWVSEKRFPEGYCNKHSSVAASQHVAVGRPAHGRSRSKKGESIGAACRQIELGDRLIEVEIPDNVASELKARKVSHETRAYEVRRVKSHCSM
jgi:hypothetical protein